MNKLYVWNEFQPHYWSGVAFCIASSEEQARNIIIDLYKVDNKLIKWGPVTIFDIEKLGVIVGACDNYRNIQSSSPPI